MAQRTSRGFLQRVQDEFQSERLLPGLTSGLLMVIAEALFAPSVGSLVFTGELAAYQPYGLGMALVSATPMLIENSLWTL